MESPRRKTSVEWPTVVDDRLRMLVAIAEHRTGRRTSAAELLSALICAQSTDPERVAHRIRQFRALAPEDIAHGNDATLVKDASRRGRPRRG